MRNWEKYLLVDVADVKLSNVDKKTNQNERFVRLCNYTDVYKNSFINSEKAKYFMIATCNEIEFENFKLKKGQVAITKDSETRDDIGISTYISEDFDDVVLGYHTSLITPYESKLNGSFLHYWFKTRQAKKYFENNAGGSGQRCTLPLDTIKSIPLYLPDLKTQDIIASVLFALDSKTELNKRINAELESMAKTIYDYWFVQFDFPDKNGKPYKTSGGKMVWNQELKREIPIGWEVTELRNYLISNRGVSYNGKDINGEGIPMINLNSFNVNSTYKPEGVKSFSGPYSTSKVLKPFDLVMCNTQQTDLDPQKDIIGKSFLVPDIFESEIVSSHHLTTINVKKDILKYYLNSLFNTEYFHRYISGYATGTNILGLNFEGVLSYRTAIPNDDVLSKYKFIIINVEKQKSRIIKENQKLSELRDWLLPMLMNGQVKVGDIQEEVLSKAAEPRTKYGK